MINKKVLLSLLFISLMSFSVWDSQSYSSKVCFNITPTTYSKANPQGLYSYPVTLAVILKNTTINVTSGIVSYHQGTKYDVYLFAYNTTHNMYFVPVINSNVEYCIYAGGTGANNLANIAQFYEHGIFNPSHSQYNSVTSLSGNGFAIAKINATGFGGIELLDHSFTPYVQTNFSSGIEIIRLRVNPTTNKVEKYVYDENYTLHNNTNNQSLTDVAPYLSKTYITSGNITYEWYFGGFNLTSVATTPVYEAIDTNIQFLAPAWKSSYDMDESIYIAGLVSGTYDNCSILLNNVSIYNQSNITNATTFATSTSSSVVGSNELIISCYYLGNETHNYDYYIVSNTDISALFYRGVENDLSNCSTAVQTNLSYACDESYRIKNEVNFGAVICKNLNLTPSYYACFNATIQNYTKRQNTGDNYTIFYIPSTFSYAIGILQQEHIGASFRVSNQIITGGIELYLNKYFVYLPAQNITRDCSVIYGTTCSWHQGFILNNATIYVSEKGNSNYWYKTPGTGIVGFGENYSKDVIDISLVPFTALTSSSTGIYIRRNCYAANNTYYINIMNTVQKYYTITIIGDVSHVVTNNATGISLSVPLSGIRYIGITDGFQNTNLCYWNNNQTLFIPFNVSFLSGTNFNATYIFIWIIFLFCSILSVFIPFSLFIPLIINDSYSIVSTDKMSYLIGMIILGSFVINAKSYNRGVKQLLLSILVIIAYVMILEKFVYQATGLQTPSAITDFTKTIEQLTNVDDVFVFLSGVPTLIVSLFNLIIHAPDILFDDLINPLLQFISPQVASGFKDITQMITLGFKIYLIVKAYEVISNRFRDV